ncbi:MAG: segregation/condensation protein A [Raineya sp.]|nr:segregation/condensation protein A [Raineya sp.]MDW8295522.1 segregation/condensation protein A [Raineya sp.]
MATFEIKLPLFEGPFDLLLFFIERDELDIYDIPIAKITQDFLDYIHHLEKLNIEVASEFILVAGTLVRIKAKMLLPRPELDEKGNEIDPRDELVRHLLEYKKYKSIVSELAKLEEERLQKEARGNILAEIRKIAAVNSVETELQDIDLYKLLKIYEKVTERYKNNIRTGQHTILQYPYSIERQKKYLLERLQTEQRLSFEDIISENAGKMYFIYTFLSILEMLQEGLISIYVGVNFNNFWIKPYQPQEVLVEVSEV